MIVQLLIVPIMILPIMNVALSAGIQQMIRSDHR